MNHPCGSPLPDLSEERERCGAVRQRARRSRGDTAFRSTQSARLVSGRRRRQHTHIWRRSTHGSTLKSRLGTGPFLAPRKLAIRALPYPVPENLQPEICRPSSLIIGPKNARCLYILPGADRFSGKRGFIARPPGIARMTKARRGRGAPGFDRDRQPGRRSAVRRTEAARRG